MMYELKKKIVYYYIIFTAVLVILEWYLFQYALIKIPEVYSLTEGKAMIVEIIAILVSVMLFILFSYGYYKKVNESIIKESNKQANERNMLFANIAHDLKNPMSSVLGFARALENGAVKEEEQQAVLHTICEKSLQVDDMIRKMFQYAKYDSEGYNLHRQKTDLCGLIREVLALQYSEIEAKNIQLDIQLPEEAVSREVDVAEFSRVLGNLISNAVKHNEEGIKLLVELRQEKSLVKIIVADSGVEIPVNQRKLIFEPFNCSDESRVAKDGSGLGLAIVKQIVNLHGGKIYVDNKVEGYTKEFVIELV